MDENKLEENQKQNNFNGQISNNTFNQTNDDLSIFSGLENNVQSLNSFANNPINDTIEPVSNIGDSFAFESNNNVQDTNVLESASTNDVVTSVSNIGDSFTSETSNNVQDTNVLESTSTNDVVTPVSNIENSFSFESNNNIHDTNILESASTSDLATSSYNMGNDVKFQPSNITQKENTSSVEKSNSVSEQTAEIVTLNLEDTNTSGSVVEPQNKASETSTPNNIKPKKEKTKKGKRILIVFLLLLVAIIGEAIYFYFNGYAKFVLSRNIAKAYNSISNVKIDSTLDSILKSNTVSIDYNVNLDIKDNAELLGGINNISAKYTYSENKSDKKGLLNLESKINKEQFIDLDALLKDSKVYFKIKDVMDKYYFTDYEFVSLFESLDNSDSKYILDIIKDSVLNNIKNEDLKQSNEDIVIDNKSLKTVKVSLNINDDLLIRIAKDIINKIENDDKALEILSNNTKISKDELKKEIADIKSSINNYTTSSEESIIYNMYTDILGNAIKHELIMDEYVIDYLNYNDVKELVVKSNGVSVFNIKIAGKESGTVSGNIMSMMSITGDYTANKINLNLKAIDNSMEMKVVLESDENKVSDKEYVFNSSLNISVLADNTEALNAVMKFDGKFNSDVTINEVNTENSKNINDITEEELESIFSKLEELPGISLLYDEMILNSVGEAKESAAVASANNIITAINYNEQMVGFDNSDLVGKFTTSRGTGANANKITKLSSSVRISGDEPSYLDLTTDNQGMVISGVIEVSDYCVKVSDGSASYDDVTYGTCK